MSTLFAYFDPGSGSLIIQLLIGGSAGLLVAGKFVWDSIRGKPRKTDAAEGEQAAKDSSGEIPQFGAT